MESQLRGLHGLGVTSDSYGALVLLKKLPQELRSRKVSENDWSLDRIMSELNKEIKAREQALEASSKTPSTGAHKKISTAATLHTRGQTVSCCYCQRNHPPESCRTVKNVDARKRSLREGGRCYVCLLKGHIGAECRSGKRCSSCGGKHHISICYRNRRTDQSTANQSEPTPQESS